LENGHFVISNDMPGLGIELDSDFINRHIVR